MQLRTVSLFSGAGGLDLGVHAALRAFGFEPRTVLYCEAEPWPQAILDARARDGGLDDAPIWPDVRTLPAHLLRGRVDAVVAGFPCQDLSVAGRRAGLGEGTRSGLFFDLLRVATDSGARLVFLENVGGIASAATDVPQVEPEDGDQERAISVVLGALSDVGFDAAWVPLRASDVGAPHQRLRWFCIGWRVDDPDGGRLLDQQAQALP